MGYVFNSDCGFQARGVGFFGVSFRKTRRFLLACWPVTLLPGSRCNLFARSVRSDVGRRNGMGKLLIALSVFLASYLPLNASSPTDPLPYNLPSVRHLNGNGKTGECLDYPLSLSPRLP